jgi:transcriptional antiterminator RfaH
MPILPAEPNLYPEALFQPEESLPPDGRAWWVLHTKPRQEKSLARQLYEGRVPFYLPLVGRRSLIRGRPTTSYVPLFTSYVFLRANAEERVAALATSRVVGVLRVPSQDGLWRDLRQISRLIASGEPVTPEDRLEPGMVVEISNGPLEGMRGKILRSASGRRFVVEVDFIQRGASVVLEDYVLTRVVD